MWIDTFIQVVLCPIASLALRVKSTFEKHLGKHNWHHECNSRFNICFFISIIRYQELLGGYEAANWTLIINLIDLWSSCQEAIEVLSTLWYRNKDELLSEIKLYLRKELSNNSLIIKYTQLIFCIVHESNVLKELGLFLVPKVTSLLGTDCAMKVITLSIS